MDTNGRDEMLVFKIFLLQRFPIPITEPDKVAFRAYSA